MSRLHTGARARCVLGLVLAAVVLAAPGAQALRVVQFNLTNYPFQSFIRNPHYRTILQPLGADMVVVQEMTGFGTNPPGLADFQNNVLNTLEPGEWAVAPFWFGNNTNNALFYKPSKVQIVDSWAFYPNPATNLRLVTVWRVKPVGYSASAAEFRIYSCHLKASQGFENDRFNEAIGIRDSMNTMPPGTHALLCGDFNIYSTAEAAFSRFVQSLPDNDGRVYDVQNALGNWHDASGFAAIHTQCPCLNNCPAGFNFSGGGMDDRFDMLLPTYAFNNGTGLEILPSTYRPVGNDGFHFNKAINSTPLIPEGQPYADALVLASDHLPVRVDLQVPAMITLAPPSAIAFGSVIVGATASQVISVTNPAVSPADNLDYVFVAGSGFVAPGGNFSLAPGAPAALHTISMNTGTDGVKAGTLAVASDAVDATLTNIALSGTVLRHAVPSFDGTSTVQATAVDFGTHVAGQFVDQTVDVHNAGFDALQAELVLTGATITGGSGRFSIVGGFSPVQVGSTPHTFTIHFDDSGLGAPGDSTFAATLTFATADQALPGAQPQPNLVVTLGANAVSTDIESSALPVATRLYAPVPNPPGSGGTSLRFDLAQPGGVRLDVFDVAGRRVANLASARYFAGAHAVRWTSRDDAGQPLGSGVYFVRMTGRFATQTVRVTVVR